MMLNEIDKYVIDFLEDKVEIIKSNMKELLIIFVI